MLKNIHIVFQNSVQSSKYFVEFPVVQYFIQKLTCFCKKDLWFYFLIAKVVPHPIFIKYCDEKNELR